MMPVPVDVAMLKSSVKSESAPPGQEHGEHEQPQQEKQEQSDGSSESDISQTEGGSGAKNPSSWDPEDDILLRHLKEIKNLGWKEIALYFENRTPNACQFRWRRLKSGNLKSNRTATVDVSDYPVVVKKLTEEEITGNSNTSKNKSNNPNTNTNTSTSGNVNGNVNGNGNGNGNTTNKKTPGQHNNNNNVGSNTAGNNSSFAGTNGKTAGLHFPIIPLSRRTSIASISGSVINSAGSSVSSAAATVSNQRSHTSLAKNKFPKVRSFSHSVGPSAQQLQALKSMKFKEPRFKDVNGSAINDENESENVGFIPKIIVKSRRSSFTHPPVPINNGNSSTNLNTIPAGSGLSISPPSNSSLSNSMNGGHYLQNGSFSSNLANALNTTLVTSKSRKSSFSINSRRSSFNISSNTTSRRPSIISAPNSMQNSFVLNHTNSANILHPATPKGQKKSPNKRDSIPLQPTISGSPNTNSNFTESPVNPFTASAFKDQYTNHPEFSSAFQQENPERVSQSHENMEPKSVTPSAAVHYKQLPWSFEEDQLLTENRLRNLSLTELSILLPNRSENEIKWRLDSFSRNVL